jgi:hypothetical protein
MNRWMEGEQAKIGKLWNALIWEPEQMVEISAEA